MKKAILLMSWVACSFGGYGQSKVPVSKFEYQPYFSAVIVSNIDSSAQWYMSVFGLKVKNEIKDSKNGYQVAILESPVFLLELLELRGSLSPREILKSQPEDTKLQGHFKIGFKVKDMDACMKHLAFLKINVPKIWTDSSTGKRNFLISDPSGNLIQFYE